MLRVSNFTAFEIISHINISLLKYQYIFINYYLSLDLSFKLPNIFKIVATSFGELFGSPWIFLRTQNPLLSIYLLINHRYKNFS